MKFHDYLHQLRKSKKVSQVVLSERIGVSQRYISQLEIATSSPPSFEICQKICNVLNLSKQEKHAFMVLALIDRISNIKPNKSFLDYLNSCHFSLEQAFSPVQNKGTLPLHQPKSSDQSAASCIYQVTFYVKNKKRFLNEAHKAFFYSLFQEIFQSFDYPLMDLDVFSNQLTFVCGISPLCHIDPWIKNIQSFSESEFFQKFTQNRTSKFLWQAAYSIRTCEVSQIQANQRDVAEYIVQEK